MSESVRSDGKNDKLVLQLIAAGFKAGDREQIDKVFADRKISLHLKYKTVVFAQAEYLRAYGRPNLYLHHRLVALGLQNENYRQMLAGEKDQTKALAALNAQIGKGENK